jgi:surface antigen
VSPEDRARLNQEIGQAKLDARRRAKDAAEKAKREAKARSNPAARSIATHIPTPGSKAVEKSWPGFSELRNGRTPAPDSALGYGYCTDYVRSVYARANQPLALSGDAARWIESARHQGDKFVILDPSQIERVPAGAIAVWGNRNDPTKPGHVAIVQGNDHAQKTIRFSEANLGGRYPANGLGSEQVAYLQKEFITANFNVVTEVDRSYQAAQSRAARPAVNHDLDLLGFIVPK